MNPEKTPPAYLTQQILRPGMVPERPADSPRPGKGKKNDKMSTKTIVFGCLGLVFFGIFFCCGSSFGLMYLADHQIRTNTAKALNDNKEFVDEYDEIKASELTLSWGESAVATRIAKNLYDGGKFYVMEVNNAAEGDEIKIVAVYDNSTQTLGRGPSHIIVIYNGEESMTLEDL